MKKDETPDHITTDAIRTQATKAPKASKDLEVLNELRYHTIPQTLSQRKVDGDAFLEKTEVVSLVDWKLKHGTYRPNLAKLVASNSVEDVRSATSSAYSKYKSDTSNPTAAFALLQKLKGIGPATASLLLAVHDPHNVPFFSDELFRWLHWEDARSKGWDRSIKYTLKEYKQLLERMEEVRDRLKKEEKGETVSADEIERAAYNISKSAFDTVAQDKEEKESSFALLPPSSKAKISKSELEKKRKRGAEKGDDGSTRKEEAIPVKAARRSSMRRNDR